MTTPRIPQAAYSQKNEKWEVKFCGMVLQTFDDEGSARRFTKQFNCKIDDLVEVYVSDCYARDCETDAALGYE